ncbi:MAG: hypothetical protein HRT98_03075 [Mycoplasmatales bacterium]|nr:hypothetical protein [Mycoplasmatales bacterium]
MNKKWVRDVSVYPGVTFVDIENTFIEKGAKIAKGCFIEPLVSIDSKSTIEEGVKLYQGVVIKESFIGEDSTIGQYALIRNNTILLGKNLIGPQSEISNSTFHIGSSAYHKAFVSDATIGEETQIGASVITANSWHDSKRYETIIGKNAKIGVNVVFVAPIKIGDGAIIAAGSTITKNVGTKQLAFGRARQVTKEQNEK